MRTPLIAVSTDTKDFEKYIWHATPQPYLDAAVSTAGVLPMLLPSLGDKLDLDSVLETVDGVLVTGSKSNVYPELYGAVATDENGPYDHARDATTLPLIRKAIEKGIPLLAICRGIQELNVALGGTLATEIHEREGAFDHRGPQDAEQAARFAIRQTIKIAPEGCLAGIFGATEVQVNSVHRQGVDSTAQSLQVEAVAEDGTVEAVSVKNAPAFAVGVQWHPEYWAHNDDASARVFKAFGNAVRNHAAQRDKTRMAAE
ncbi:gamma-glutamyl-gamma-aminobutyrate hydrolase family protein [uncultured Nitratireductor sp.]|uniref:gamma-glutamyl-gamma-aminobutyrate hydrolase family protein n=1 Tax=uncultured Nitratireductor sp. TaxID=520953 RepID=UPI0025F6D880|nr:gamma-glutamyl-gamma-aminobutyrate hydrolase family protein [uncultured Nitratireductor sp.]